MFEDLYEEKWIDIPWPGTTLDIPWPGVAQKIGARISIPLRPNTHISLIAVRNNALPTSEE